MKKEASRRRTILLAHGDPAWVDRAKTRLESLGFEVTSCPEPSWAVDLLSGSVAYDLAVISSEIDPDAQARILKAVRKHRHPPRLMILLDNLDTSSMIFRRDSDLVTHRVTEDTEAFVKAVVDQVGLPSPPA